jgi:hypothetical protein
VQRLLMIKEVLREARTLVLSVAALMVAMIVATAMPAFARVDQRPADAGPRQVKDNSLRALCRGGFLAPQCFNM